MLVDSNTVLPFSVTPQPLKLVAGGDPKIVEDRGSIEHLELPKGGPLNTRPEFSYGFTPEQALSVAVSETPDHTTSERVSL